MKRSHSFVGFILLALALFLVSAPAFADNPWTERPGKGGAGGGAGLVGEYPWIGGPGKRAGGGAELVGEWPWATGPPKRGGEELVGEDPWIFGPPKRGGNNNAEAFLRWYLLFIGK